jgi:hypothetical protein
MDKRGKPSRKPDPQEFEYNMSEDEHQHYSPPKRSKYVDDDNSPPPNSPTISQRAKNYRNTDANPSISPDRLTTSSRSISREQTRPKPGYSRPIQPQPFNSGLSQKSITSGKPKLLNIDHQDRFDDSYLLKSEDKAMMGLQDSVSRTPNRRNYSSTQGVERSSDRIAKFANYRKK